ncbi:MAG: histidinol-phosphate transaminase [Methanobacterium sp.]|nr:histidinol-phosphate transaminase [Methanobacterium sp.]
MKIKKVVEELDPYVPGRSIKEIARDYNLNPDEIIKLGSNENPLGTSSKAVDAVINDLKLMYRYPESDLKGLTSSIASYSGVSTEQVIIGGDGADEILDVLGKTLIDPGDEFIVTLPTYTYYEFTFKIHGAVPVYAKWNMPENKVNIDSILNSITSRTKIIFLCTPNNPTGGIIEKGDIKTILESTDSLVVVDEAYFEFSGENNVDLLKDYDNLFILRTFSKVMGLAGMRIGYGLGNSQLISYMKRVKPVFSLTRLSQIAAYATLTDTEYITESISVSIESRDYLYRELSKIPELDVYESKANYLLADIRRTGMNSPLICEKLLERGIIVRDCRSFRGLDDYWIRISVGTLEEDEKFINVLKQIIG